VREQIKNIVQIVWESSRQALCGLAAASREPRLGADTDTQPTHK
jgi:hypothetical protein